MTFKDTLTDSQNATNIIKDNISVFNKLNFEKETIDNILDNSRKEECDTDLIDKNITLCSDTNFYLIESLFIDCIILNCQNSNKIEITKENIEKSKEVRLATKEYIMKKFNEFMSKYSEITPNSLTEISNKKLISDLIEIEFIFDTNNKLNGFSIEKSKISRIGHLDYIKACDIFKDFMSKFARFSYNNPPLI